MATSWPESALDSYNQSVHLPFYPSKACKGPDKPLDELVATKKRSQYMVSKGQEAKDLLTSMYRRQLRNRLQFFRLSKDAVFR
jgi:hypothetical protein